MAASPCVVLYGNSLFLAGIRTALKERTQLELVTIEPAGTNAVSLVSAHHPTAVVFDTCLAEPDFTLALLRERPEVLMVGVDPSSDVVLVLSARHEKPDLASDLVALIAETCAGGFDGE